MSLLAQQGSGPAGSFVGPEYIPLTEARNANGSAIAAAAAGGGDFVVAIVADTTMALLGHSATSNTKTDVLLFEIVMPPWKAFGDTLTINVYAESVLSSAPSSSRFMAAKLQSLVGSPAIGAALTRTAGSASQMVNAGLTALSWTFDTSAIAPGATMLLTLTSSVIESDGGSAQMQIDSVIKA